MAPIRVAPSSDEGSSDLVSDPPLTDQLAAYFGVKEGVLVSAVEEKSPRRARETYDSFKIRNAAGATQ